jgi:hypothetical protein
VRVFENRVLRRIFGPKKEKMAGGWRRLHSEELRNLYVLPNVISVIRSRKIIWAGCVARVGETRNEYNILVGKFEGKRLLGRTCIDGKTILEWIFGKSGGKVWTGFIWLSIGISGGFL